MRILSNSNYAKKRDILSEKRESVMVLKKREFTPESSDVDAYSLRHNVLAVTTWLHV